MPIVDLVGSYGYLDPITGERRYYGPGQVDVPDGLLQSLGLVPVTGAAEVEVVQNLHANLLPAEFPGRAYLDKAGYGTVEAVRKLDFDGLVAVKGIGPKLAGQIIQAIGEVE